MTGFRLSASALLISNCPAICAKVARLLQLDEVQFRLGGLQGLVYFGELRAHKGTAAHASRGLLLRNRTITGEMHDAGQDFARTFVASHLDSAGTLRLDDLPRSAWQDRISERRARARKRIGQALDAVGGIASPGGCAVWHVAGWNGRILNQYEAKGILVAALGMLAVHYGYSRPCSVRD